MKKIVFWLALMLLVLVVPALCFAAGPRWSTSSGEKTADLQVFTGTGVLTSVQLITDGSNPATATVHDGTSNSDKKIGEFKCDGLDYYCGWIWDFPVWVNVGIYVDVSGTDASYIIEYMDIQ